MTNFHSLWAQGEILEEKPGIGFRSRNPTFRANLDENLHFRGILEIIKSGMRIMLPKAYFLSLIGSPLEFSSRDKAGIMISIINVKKLSKSFNDFPRLTQLIRGGARLLGTWRGPSGVLAIASWWYMGSSGSEAPMYCQGSNHIRQKGCPSQGR